jgi:hypothetical protein
VDTAARLYVQPPDQGAYPMKFRILSGPHIMDHPTDKKRDGTPVEVMYHPASNPIIETDVDLEARFNMPGSRKFERIYEQDHANVTARTWDPAKETIEQFVKRMQSTIPPSAGPSQIQLPPGWTKEAVEEFAASEEIPFEDAVRLAKETGATPAGPQATQSTAL